jgi:hypothetical protein
MLVGKIFAGLSSGTLAGLLACMTAAPAVGQPAPSLERCLRLIAEFDRYNSRVGDSQGSSGGRLDRGVAEVQCRRGDYAGGIRTMEDVLKRNLIPVPPD